MSLRSKSVPLTLGTLLAVVVATVLVLGVWPALARRQALAETAAAEEARAPRVTVVEAAPAPQTVKVVLPCRLDALEQTALYAQVGGYLGPLQADLGDAVKAGQVLVEIQTPILDRQIEQNQSAVLVAHAKIDLAQARLDLAKATLARLRSVGDARAISQQAIDEAAANEKSDSASLAAAQADLAAAEADGRRLAAQKLLARMVAPFDGEITERNLDAGALVVADRTDNVRPVFRVTNRSRIRAFVDVPQSLAAVAKQGVPMEITVRELPGQVFKTQLERTAPALSGTTRTRLVEGFIDNAQQLLLPGMFAEASLTLPRSSHVAMVPGEALVIREGKQSVAVVDEGQTLRYVPVTVGRDSGLMVEILDGVPPGARVVVNLSKQLPDGTPVQPVPRAKP